ncbi:MAG: C40 family peptidase [Treponema sp.]|nr:C40 family peptidase [Treponema sp.]
MKQQQQAKKPSYSKMSGVLPIMTIVRVLFFVMMIFCISGLFAAPLEGGFALAPRSSASADEKDRAYIDARLKVIESSRKYLGTPYRYGGMTPAGLDCSGFIGISFRDALGVTTPRSASGLYTWTARIPYDRAQPGDLLFFRTNSTRNITHVGLYLGERVFIHSASAGSKTGVIYSSLDEQYWSQAFAGAGRAFPQSTPFNIDGNNRVASAAASSSPSIEQTSGQTSSQIERPVMRPPEESSNGRLLVGAAIAPTWNGFLKGGELVRGFSSQLCLGAETYTFGTKMVFGVEVRPEYDGALGVFRLPVTLSWGPSEQIRIFAGPVFSFGEATLPAEDGQRYYSGGSSWLGTVGITAAPFSFKSAGGDFSPYIEAAWQSYFSDNRTFDLASDFSAGFRFSSGIRWLLHVR